MKQKGFAPVIILILVGLGFLVYFNFFYKSKATLPNQPTTVQTTRTEVNSRYTVEYPNNFFINSKGPSVFTVAESKFLGNDTHIPIAGIGVYTNVISDNMDLNEWLNGVGDPNPATSPTGKSCKDFINQLRQELKYGDLFNDPYRQGDNCWYFGVSNVKNKTVSGIPALEFNTENVSDGGAHTIFKYKDPSGNISLIDIFFSITGQSDENDKTANAYLSFLQTFKPKDPQ